MFMFPEPPPLDYYITDVSPSILSDGIFHHGKAVATHKHVAKQLRPIKRRLYDPLAPIQELDSRVLDRSLVREKELYVDSPVKDNGVIYQTLSIMPKCMRDYQRTQKPIFSIFPRSPQYEYWYIRDQRLKNVEKHRPTTVEFAEKEETYETDDEPCGLLKPPSWLKDKTRKPSRLPVGNINDYTFEKLKEFDVQDAKLSERLHMDHPQKYIPGVIHRLKNSEDTSMKDALKRADAFEVVSKKDQVLPKSPPVDKPIYPPKKHPCELTVCKGKEDQVAKVSGSKIISRDTRWQPLDDFGSLKTDPKRQEEMRKLTRSFLHDLHTWYSKNKPTKAIIPLRHPGKKAIPEMRFSHL